MGPSSELFNRRLELFGHPVTPRLDIRSGAALALMVSAFVGLGALAAGVTLMSEATGNAAGVEAAIPIAVQKGVLKLGVERLPRPARPTDYQTRREEGFVTVVRDDLRRQLRVAVELVAIAPHEQAQALAQRRVDALLVHRPPSDDETTVRTGYQRGFTYLMRSDTPIRSWADARQRSVCLVEGNGAARIFAMHAGSAPQAYADPAKALAAMRAGECDAAIVETSLAAQFVTLERWIKFNATLPARDASHLVFVTAPGDRLSARRLQRIADGWQRQKTWQAWINTWVTEVDFETYLEQDAPDCH